MFRSSQNLRLAAEMRALQRVAAPWREARTTWFDGTPESIESRLAATERVLSYARGGLTQAHAALEREASLARAELREAAHRLMVDFLDDGARAFKGSKRVAKDDPYAAKPPAYSGNSYNPWQAQTQPYFDDDDKKRSWDDTWRNTVEPWPTMTGEDRASILNQAIAEGVQRPDWHQQRDRKIHSGGPGRHRALSSRTASHPEPPEGECLHCGAEVGPEDYLDGCPNCGKHPIHDDGAEFAWMSGHTSPGPNPYAKRPPYPEDYEEDPYLRFSRLAGHHDEEDGDDDVDCPSCKSVSYRREFNQQNGHCPFCSKYNHELDMQRKHSSLGHRVAQMSYEDTMAYIDQTLAEGDKSRKKTESEARHDQFHSDPRDYPKTGCGICRERVLAPHLRTSSAAADLPTASERGLRECAHCGASLSAEDEEYGECPNCRRHPHPGIAGEADRDRYKRYQSSRRTADETTGFGDLGPGYEHFGPDDVSEYEDYLHRHDYHTNPEDLHALEHRLRPDLDDDDPARYSPPGVRTEP